MLKLTRIALVAALAAVSVFAQKTTNPKNPVNNKAPKPVTMVHVDDAKRVYYRDDTCKAAAGLPLMKLPDAKTQGYKAGKCK